MSKASQILQATGNIWRVDCYESGNRRRILQTLYVRTDCILKAEEIGRRRSGRRCVDARPWNPETDRKCWGWIEKVSV